MPVIHVSHDLPELLHVCEELLLIDAGRMAAHGPLAAIAGDPALLPLLHDAGLVNVLRGTVDAHDPDAALTAVRLDGGAIVQCPLRPDRPGAGIELLLRPDDIALATGEVEGISLQNRLPGIIRRITAASDRVLVTVDVGQEVLAEVSARTVVQLGLEPGRQTWILFKAMALAGRG
jgi:molybdate transport system ATP-binding protein